MLMKTVYDFTVKDRQGQAVSLKDYEGKVLLIVNTATGCGFTPHYEPLEAMYKELKEKGLEILDFPCNQFANQAPGSEEEIHQFCTPEVRHGLPAVREDRRERGERRSAVCFPGNRKALHRFRQRTEERGPEQVCRYEQ